MKTFLKKKTMKSDNIVANNIKIFQKMKSKAWLIVQKNITKTASQLKTELCFWL